MPRQSKRTPEVEDKILTGMAAGIPLAVICRDPSMPHMSTWREWCRADESLNIAHGHARDDGFDMIAADTLAIADDAQHDTKTTAEGVEVCNSEWISRSKLRVETRLKLLAKWDPKRYGDKIDHSHSGGSGGPVTHVIELVGVSPKLLPAPE